MHRKNFTLLAGAVTLAAAHQAADFLLPTAVYPSYGCQDECQKAINLAVPSDLAFVGEDFDFDFYETAHNFSSSLAPGEVLKFDTLDANNRSVSSGTSLFRMQYTSRDLDGSIVPVTAFVAFPQANFRQSDGRFPLVAWAHGTIGLFPGCAQSNGPKLYDYGTWQPLVQHGCAVVATDYAGLGNNYTSHKYGSHLAHINDIYYSVQAVRKVFGYALTDEWMSVGHSQGGGAVWKLAESHFVRNDTKYLGTVALAPSTYAIDMLFENVDRDISQQIMGYITYLPFALERAIPSFNRSFVAPAMQKRLELAERMQVCIDGMFSMVSGLNETQILDRAALEQSRPAMLAWQNEHTAARGDRSPAPVLVIQSDADTTVFLNTTRTAWENSCAAGNEIHLRVYQGQEHSPSVEASGPEWVDWIDDKFYGRNVHCSGKCSEKVRKLFAGKNTKAAPES